MGGRSEGGTEPAPIDSRARLARDVGGEGGVGDQLSGLDRFLVREEVNASPLLSAGADPPSRTRPHTLATPGELVDHSSARDRMSPAIGDTPSGTRSGRVAARSGGQAGRSAPEIAAREQRRAFEAENPAAVTVSEDGAQLFFACSGLHVPGTKYTRKRDGSGRVTAVTVTVTG